MADLDDFFAKKDKKKSKTKKFLTQDELREKLEDNSKKAAAEPVKPKFQEENGSGNITENKSNDDEEWKEIQEEKKDYSNLKIGQLSLNDNNHYDDDSELEEDGESGNERSSVVDPWKKVDSTAESGSSQNQSQEASKTTATASKLYISPALRAAQNAPMRPSKLRSSTAPDISNEDFFPTLANARPEEQRKKKNEPAFEEVRHGGRVQHIKPNAQQLKTDEVVNRFRSLEETDS